MKKLFTIVTFLVGVLTFSSCSKDSFEYSFDESEVTVQNIDFKFGEYYIQSIASSATNDVNIKYFNLFENTSYVKNGFFYLDNMKQDKYVYVINDYKLYGNKFTFNCTDDNGVNIQLKFTVRNYTSNNFNGYELIYEGTTNNYFANGDRILITKVMTCEVIPNPIN